MAEVEKWRDFELNGEIYDLSHLNAHVVEYIDNRDENNPIVYRFIVTYGLHCFAKDADDLTEEESRALMYRAPTESRHFNFDRYHLSKQLPAIIRSLSEKTTLVFHAGYGNFATVKVLDSSGVEVNYFIVFAVFREKKKFRLHVTSAYPKEDIGRIQKVSFFLLAYKLLKNQPPPKPPK